MKQQFWFEYEFSQPGENDWYSTPLTALTLEDLRKLKLVRTPYNDKTNYDLRIVKRTLTTEIIEVIE